MIPAAEMLIAVGEALGDEVRSAESTGGGSINQAAELKLASGRSAFLKYRADADMAEFQAEAAGLRWLREARALALPEVLAKGREPHSWLVLEWVEPGTLNTQGAERLGRGLAELHRAGAPAHGALPPGSPDGLLRIGSVALPMPKPSGSIPAGMEAAEAENESPRDGLPGSPAWPDFYVERLIAPLTRMASDQDALDAAGVAMIERACTRIEQIAGPSEPPSRLHGDLWAGNVLADRSGTPWLIDPAAYGGHREIDLAMLRLFGTPGGDRVFEAYDEAWPLAEGHEERIDLWQLLPLLVHAVLFGGGYGARAAAAARTYA